MKVLLINPPFEYYSRHQIFREPLSLAYLAAYLRKFGYQVKILDGVASAATNKGKLWRYGLSDQEVSAKTREYKPDVVGITCVSSLRIFDVLRIAKLIKRVDPGIKTIVGGVHPTIFPKDTVSNPEVDYVIVGEGEESLLQLIKTLESGKKLTKIDVDGCAYKQSLPRLHRGKQDGRVVENPKLHFIENLDTIPYPARDLLPMDFYFKKGTVLYGLGQRNAATIITSRSCPYRCTFCSVNLIQGLKLRLRSAINVYGEIEELVKKYGVEEILVYDDNFTFDRERVIELCRMILRKKLNFRWNTPNGVRADRLDVELLSTMKRAGCVNICIGVESGNDRIRNEVIRKGLEREKIEKALKVCAKVGMPVTGFFILGTPGETGETFKDTLTMVRTMPFSMISTFFFVPIAGTKLYDDCVKDGYITRDYWKKVNRFTRPIVETPTFNSQTLKAWEKRIYFEFVRGHFWTLLFQTLTFKSEFIKIGIVKRFLSDKFGIQI